MKDLEIKKIMTENPRVKPAAADRGFGKYFTDHMFTMDYSEEKGWHDPQICPYGPISIEPSAMVLHYGQSVFEGLKCYKAQDGRILLFRPRDNFERLNTSDDRLCIPQLDVDFALKALIELIQIDKDWIPCEPDTSLYLRPFVFSSEPLLGVRPSYNYKFMIIMSPVGQYYAEGLDPVKIYIEDEYVRAVKGGLGFTKASANYAASLKGQVKAKSLGYSQVLWLDGVERKYIEEVGAMNVFFKINGEIVTPSLGSILPGITRDSVIKLLKNWDFKVTERQISIQELNEAYDNGTLEEAFGTGTAAVISPIGELNWNGKLFKLSNGEIGEISKRLYDDLTGIQYGRIKDEFNWTMEI